MTKPANSTNKPSPADTPTHRPEDNGGKSKVRAKDKQYHEEEPKQENIAKERENEEQPVHSVKKAPKA
jgi:hypothetical protein